MFIVTKYLFNLLCTRIRKRMIERTVRGFIVEHFCRREEEKERENE
jgi:hypothetical protein